LKTEKRVCKQLSGKIERDLSRKLKEMVEDFLFYYSILKFKSQKIKTNDQAKENEFSQKKCNSFKSLIK
jgi:hypothetical protein